MTTDLRYLVYTAMLTAALWIPYIVCQVRTNGPLQPSNYADPGLPRPVPPWGQRAHRAYLNAIEVFAPFAALVVAAHLTGKADAMTAFWSASFFWLRLAHAVVYWVGFSLPSHPAVHFGICRRGGHLLGNHQVVFGGRDVRGRPDQFTGHVVSDRNNTC